MMSRATGAIWLATRAQDEQGEQLKGRRDRPVVPVASRQTAAGGGKRARDRRIGRRPLPAASTTSMAIVIDSNHSGAHSDNGNGHHQEDSEERHADCYTSSGCRWG
ncbi:hypothetical protein [Gloeobacter kilaueensis]|uniref:hypothetical protein n=1 Tax=Gloeobacter kilaueensis TaxID=1416614 RepID=UPI00059EC102|nr:hypothetical protein [Gloeobacter kilaueensis]